MAGLKDTATGVADLFGGVLKGLGDTFLQKDSKLVAEQRAQDAMNRQIAESTINDPNADLSLKIAGAQYLQQHSLSLKRPSLMSEGVNKIRGKKSQPQADPTASMYQSMIQYWHSQEKGGGQPSQTPPLPGGQPPNAAAGGPQPQPQGQAPAASTPPLPTGGGAPTARPPLTTAMLQKGQEDNQQLAFQKKQHDQQVELNKKDAEDAGLKPGTPEYVQKVYGVTPGKAESLDQAAADLYKDYRSGKMTRAQLSDSLDALSDVEKAKTTKSDTAQKPSEEDKAIADHLAAQNLPNTPANRDKARVWSKNISKANTAASFSRQDANDIADAIASGDQPPTTQGLYRNAAPVRAELARRGIPLAKMEVDWKATNRFMNTLNGPQQVRLQQAISALPPMLDKIQGLYDEWKKVGADSGIKIFNKASLEAAKQLPGRAGAVAQALDTQIADLTSEMGQVYMGGNSPTDHSLGLAAKNLSGDWDDETFTEAMKQARDNVKIRKNSIDNSYPKGVSGQYLPDKGQQNAGGSAPPQGATHIVPGPDGKNHYTNDAGTVDLGVAP